MIACPLLLLGDWWEGAIPGHLTAHLTKSASSPAFYSSCSWELDRCVLASGSYFKRIQIICKFKCAHSGCLLVTKVSILYLWLSVLYLCT